MAESAPQVQYRQQLVDTFEEGMTWLRQCTVTEAVIKGNTATFLVAGSGGAEATTRGLNGLIVARADSMTQTSATLVEWQDLVRKTRFNIFQSQGDQKALMQKTTRKVLNRRIDKDIITVLDTATNNLGAAATASLAMVMKATTTLGENEVPVEDESDMFAVVSDAFMGYLMQIPEFNNSQYVDMKALNGPPRRTKRWAGYNWIRHHRLTGKGTAAEKCYFFHRDSVGSAFDSGEGLNVAIGYNDEQDYSYARASTFTGACMLQQSGVVQAVHDASAI